MLRIGLTGGIGSGKSTISRVLKKLGIPVYDSDSHAKKIMNTNQEVIEAIIDNFGFEAYSDGKLNPSYLASKVFIDSEALAKLNGIVHPAVKKDFIDWASQRQKEGYPYVVQENAILFECGFDSTVDITITVSAPLEERIQRVMKRDGTDKQKVLDRISNQMPENERISRSDYVIYNSDHDLIVPQIDEIHRNLVQTSLCQ